MQSGSAKDGSAINPFWHESGRTASPRLGKDTVQVQACTELNNSFCEETRNPKPYDPESPISKQPPTTSMNYRFHSGQTTPSSEDFRVLGSKAWGGP